MDFLNQLIDNSQVPVITAFLLGLLTALSPCPLATNVTAVGYIARSCMEGNMNKSNAQRRILWSGILYTLGRTLAYTLLGALLIYIIRQGADTFGRYCGDLTTELPIAQSSISQHLKVLKDVGLIDGEIAPPKVCYRINRENLLLAKKLFSELL